MTHSRCTKFDDAHVMEQIMRADSVNFFCASKSSIDTGELCERLHAQECGVLRINTIEYRESLRGCLACYMYKGPYPSSKEVLRR